MHIFEAKPSDAKAINAYVEDIYATSDHLITRTREYNISTWGRRRWLVQKRRNPYEICLLAVNNGAPIGMIECWTDRRASVRHTTRISMSVKKDWRCKGVGALLLRHFIDWIKNHPVLERIELHVHDDNEHAKKLYESFGFIVEGTRGQVIRYEDGRIVDDHIMALWP